MDDVEILGNIKNSCRLAAVFLDGVWSFARQMLIGYFLS
jgi:hypothetical protein